VPIHYELLPERRLVSVTYSGKVTSSDISDHFEKLARDDRIGPDWRCLVDATVVESAEFSFVSIRQLIREIGSDRLLSWPAAIVTESDLVYGLARIYLALMEVGGERIKVFRDLRAAEAWLDDEVTGAAGLG
jgi:hypothetical protein